MEPYNEKYQTTIDALYHKWGVGESHEQKCRFWESKEPNTNIYPFERNSREWLRVFEVSYLATVFPEDFPSC